MKNENRAVKPALTLVIFDIWLQRKEMAQRNRLSLKSMQIAMNKFDQT